MIVNLLKRESLTVKELAGKLRKTQKEVREIIKGLKEDGINIRSTRGRYYISLENGDCLFKSYVSRGDNKFKFGFLGDTHLCSKYEKLDVLNDLYRIFEEEDVDRVFHTGNWIEGEARFNKHDIKIFGMDDQINYLVDNYPCNGIHTFAVAGDDHEGWYGQRSGIDIGRHCENLMRNGGRDDWHNLGYMESYVPLKNANSGKKSHILVMHPGGGSAYAVSYRPQKIVESFTGGEKPNVLLIGHYHKLSYNIIRNVHTIQTGCTQAQTPFMRKKSINAHIGGGICELRQDPKDGSIVSCKIEFFTYYHNKKVNNRWKYADK